MLGPEGELPEEKESKDEGDGEIEEELKDEECAPVFNLVEMLQENDFVDDE